MTGPVVSLVWRQAKTIKRLRALVVAQARIIDAQQSELAALRTRAAVAPWELTARNGAYPYTNWMEN